MAFFPTDPTPPGVPDLATDATYRFNRDDPSRAGLRQLIETMWAEYEGYCPDGHFLQNAQTNFNAMLWQMRLTLLLKHYRHELIEVTEAGPDIRMRRNGISTLIEVVAARPGDGPDAVPTPPVGQTYHPPDDQIVLRIRNAIEGKVQQYRRWLEAGVVQADQPFLIAITAGEMTDATVAMDGISHAERAVFPIGHGHFQVPVGGQHEDVRLVFPPREAIQRRNGAMVPTTVFTDPAYNMISALIYTPHHAVNNLEWQDGRDVMIIYNPMATNPVPRGILGFGGEVWVDQNGMLQKENVWGLAR